MTQTTRLPRAFIFDWDNTLVDSWNAIMQSINHVRNEYKLPTWSLAEVKTNCTRAARESFPDWFGNEWKKAYDIYYKKFDEVRKASKIRELAGAGDLLRHLKAQNVPTFVVSNKHGDYLRLEAAMLSWQNMFAAIIGAHDAVRDKPSREPVDLALHKGGLKAHAGIWFVGDSETDVQCALNAGCTPVLIGDAETAARLSVARVFSDCTALLSSFYNAPNNKI